MTQRYIPEDNTWLAYDDFDKSAVSKDIYAQVGARFPITWDGNRVVIDFTSLPSGVSENEVKKAVKDNHPHR